MQNVLKLLVVCVLFSGVGSYGFAAEGSIKQYIPGAGAVQCGKMLVDLEKGGTQPDSYISWMQGYLTAKNIAREIIYKLPPVDLAGHEGQLIWLKNYCEDNPLEQVGVGVQMLWNELVSMQESE
jgi:hypothetical protein